MKIRLHGLPRGTNTLSDSVIPAEIGLPEDIFQQPISVSIVLEDVGDLINADYEFMASCFGICDRCAGDFNFNLKATGRLLFFADTDKTPSTQENVKYFHPDSPEIDISQDILDALILELPSKLLCSEDCRGLCQNCGTDLNTGKCKCKTEIIDPRWAALSGLDASGDTED